MLACTVLSTTADRIPHGLAYIEASDLRTSTFAALFFLVGDIGIGISVVFGSGIPVGTRFG
jgi:hypothetical protein